MKLINAHFENFRLLRDVDIQFSTSEEQPLTVIRAENESGKTTLLLGLQWALFGEEGLPSKGMRLHPIDWNPAVSPTAKVVAEVDFEHAFERKDRRSGQWVNELKRYRLRRVRTDRVLEDGSWEHVFTDYSLKEIRHSGYEDVPNPTTMLEQIMTSGVRDLFFTDGDRALSFITTQLPDAEKRTLVRQAIRDMLGFEILEKSIEHVKQAATALKKETAQHSGDKELAKLAASIAKLEEEIAKEEVSSENFISEVELLAIQITETQGRIEEALSHGDREDLVRQKKENDEALDRERRRGEKALAAHADLFKSNSEALALSLLGQELLNAQELIKKVSETGRIPRTSLPVLKERLKMGECICGTKLTPGTPQYDHIQHLILKETDTRAADNRLTSLRFDVGAYLDRLETHTSPWLASLHNVVADRDSSRQEIERLQYRARELEHEIDAIPETNIRVLRDHKSLLEKHHREKLTASIRAQNRIGDLRKSQESTNNEFERAQRQSTKAKKFRAEEQATQDVLEVIRKTYAVIESEAVPAVTLSMNESFLRMINSDLESNSVVRSAEVTPSYDIKVYGPENRSLHPDRDLNGASRRALTIAFILAITKQSNVVAPLVIDTPLGMTSGEVKRSIVTELVTQAQQPILFLTRSEISSIEDQLDEAAGAFNTLTNSAHYPKMVVNNADPTVREVLVCQCTHRQYCSVCERKDDRLSGKLRTRSSPDPM